MRTDVSKYELNPIWDFGFMRSDAGEKHTAQKELYYTGLSRGFNLAFVGSASRAHKKPNFISYGSSEKVFFMDISCMACTHCVGGSSEPRLETGHVSWQARNRETYIAFSIQCVRLGLGHILNISSPSLALHSPSVALHSRGLKPGPYNIITPESHLHGLGDGGPCPRLGTLAINM